MADSYISTDTNKEDNLIADITIDQQEEKITLLTGEVVVRGEVLGQVTASGKYRASLAASIDGSEVIKAVASEDKDATTEDKETVGLFTGSFQEGGLTLNDHTITEPLRDLLRSRHIFITKEIPA